MKTVGEVSALVGITVRTLYHYDECGLLSPRGRTDSGYRPYSERDLERLQEILGWRALGFSLDGSASCSTTSVMTRCRRCELSASSSMPRWRGLPCWRGRSTGRSPLSTW